MGVRNALLPTTLATVIVVLIVFGVHAWRMPRASIASPVSQDVLLNARADAATHLYPAQIDASRGYDVVGPDGLMAADYAENPGGELTARRYQKDGRTLSVADEYYSVADDSGIRLLKDTRRFALDGVTVESEQRFRQYDGSKEFDGRLLDDGSYQTSTFFGDGVTTESETVTKTDLSKLNHPPIVVRLERWLQPGHVLAYSDILDTIGANRKIEEFDSQGVLALEKHFNIFNTIGASVVAYFPGSTKVKMRSLSDRREDDATFFREDGSVDFTQEITTYCIGVTFFEEHTEKKLFHQVWLTDGPEAKLPQPPRLWTVEEFDEKGQTIRVLSFSKGVLSRQVLSNLTLMGRLYKSVTLDYDDAGKLRLSALTPAYQDPVIPSAEALKLALISSHVEDKELAAPNLEYELPVPTPSPHDHE